MQATTESCARKDASAHWINRTTELKSMLSHADSCTSRLGGEINTTAELLKTYIKQSPVKSIDTEAAAILLSSILSMQERARLLIDQISSIANDMGCPGKDCVTELLEGRSLPAKSYA